MRQKPLLLLSLFVLVLGVVVPLAPAQSDTADASPTPPATEPAVQQMAPDTDRGTLTGGLLEGLIAQADPSRSADFAPLGSLVEESEDEFEVRFTPYGAGVLSITLTHEFVTVLHDEHLKIQSARRGNENVSVDPDELDQALAQLAELGALAAGSEERNAAYAALAETFTDLGLAAYGPQLANVDSPEAAELLATDVKTWLRLLIIPFALNAVEIEGQVVDLANFGGPNGGPRGVWEEQAPGTFVATIENAGGTVIGRVRREFGVAPSSHQLTLTQTFENLTEQPLSIRWIQTGPIDPDKPQSTYGGDKRRLRFGYLRNPRDQAGDPTVLADGQLSHHHEYVGKKTETVTDAYGNAVKGYALRAPVWPDEAALERERRLVWVGLTGRYFAIVAHPIVPTGQPIGPDAKRFNDIDTVNRLLLNTAADNVQDTTVVLELVGPAVVAEPGASVTSNMGIYAGPMSTPTILADAVPAQLNLDRIVVYNFGSCMSFCTFGWLTHLLLGILRFNHMITADWAVAIILLVLVVRTCLHPITRWSQIRMQRFGVQMQSMGPKMQKLKEKYKDDPKAMQAETAKLWREEGISPAGFLGCLPMFLQSPVWIALYATLFFAAELRHEPAFYGVFQMLSGGDWRFLADLSAPDAALPLGPLSFTPPLIGNFVGEITSVNVLPLLMGVVFFAHQKYLTPPTSATLSPEQQSQQKLIRVMTVVMFPLIMYAAPSGLSIYFVTNSTIAIFENRWIRAHMNKHGMLDPDKIRAEKANKGPGFLARLQEAAAAQQQAKAGPGQRPKAKPTTNRQFKKKK